FRGDEVWGDAHFGDWGFQMGLVICALEDELGGFGDAAKIDARLKALSLEQLETIYPDYARRIKETVDEAGADGKKRALPNPTYDPSLLDRARKATAALQNGAE